MGRTPKGESGVTKEGGTSGDLGVRSRRTEQSRTRGRRLVGVPNRSQKSGLMSGLFSSLGRCISVRFWSFVVLPSGLNGPAGEVV